MRKEIVSEDLLKKIINHLHSCEEFENLWSQDRKLIMRISKDLRIELMTELNPNHKEVN